MNTLKPGRQKPAARERLGPAIVGSQHCQLGVATRPPSLPALDSFIQIGCKSSLATLARGILLSLADLSKNYVGCLLGLSLLIFFLLSSLRRLLSWKFHLPFSLPSRSLPCQSSRSGLPVSHTFQTGLRQGQTKALSQNNKRKGENRMGWGKD